MEHQSKYEIGGIRQLGHENNILFDIDQRLSLIEEKVFKKLKRLKATEAQRFLILFHLGLFTPVPSLDIQQQHKDLIISVLLDIDPSNAKKYIIELSSDNKPKLRTITNYTFLINFFKKVELYTLSDKMEEILTEIEKEQEAISKLKKDKKTNYKL
jgi:hypothetical protein